MDQNASERTAADGSEERANRNMASIVNSSSPSNAFRLTNVLYGVIPASLLVLTGFLFVTYFEGLEHIVAWSRPPLVAAEGRVLYRGQPLANAQLSTQVAAGGVRGAMGWTDEQGFFRLQTDLNGYVDGAFTGEHYVVVTAYEQLNAPAAPPLATPELYASFATTPLRIVVARDPQKNVFEFSLEGEPPARRARSNRPAATPPADIALPATRSADEPPTETPSAETPPPPAAVTTPPARNTDTRENEAGS